VIARAAERLPDGAMVFDTVPWWSSRATVSGRMRTPEGYAPPPMPWGSRRGERERIAALSPRIRDVHALRLPRAHDREFGLVAPLAQRLIPSALPRIFAVRFVA
jgi:hypothetical protein